LKIILLFCFLVALTLSAADYAVELISVPGEDQVYFLDLAGTGADSSTFKVTTPDGKEVLFSFDMRIALPVKPGQYQPPPDGFYSKEISPASQNRFRQPGWLSFKQVPGVKKYLFTFTDGAKTTDARPNPSVRTWWIEIVCDPEFTELENLNCYNGTLKKLEKGGFEADRTVRWDSRILKFDNRAKGRRIVGLLRCQGDGEHYYTISFPSAVPNRSTAIMNYFKLVPGVETEICGEGIIANPKEDLLLKGRAGTFEYIKKTTRVMSLNVQLPPSESKVGVKLKSDLLNVNDTVEFEPFGLGYENILPFTSGGIAGYRVGCWTGKPEIHYQLLDCKGKTVISGSGLKFKLNGVDEGKYMLELELLADGNPVCKQNISLDIQSGPF